MGPARDRDRYLGKMQRHGLGIVEGQDQPGSLFLFWKDCSEDIDRIGPLFLECRGPRLWTATAPRNLVFLAYASLILEPDFDGRTLSESGFDLCHFGCKAPLYIGFHSV